MHCPVSCKFLEISGREAAVHLVTWRHVGGERMKYGHEMLFGSPLPFGHLSLLLVMYTDITCDCRETNSRCRQDVSRQ